MNSDQLTAKAQIIISRLVFDDMADPLREIYIAGNADTSGMETDNVTLSFKRAQAVEMQLLAHGIPKDKIKLFAYGDSHLLVPTPPNTPMPQNRRVEIFGYPQGVPMPVQPYQTGPIKVIRIKHGMIVE